MRLARVRALIIISTLALVAVATASWAILRDTQSGAGGCEPGAIPVNLEMPKPGEVTVNVYNGTDQTGLAELVKGDLEEYGYVVAETKNSKNKDIKESAEIHFGPQSVGAGHVLRAYFLGSTGVFEPERQDAVVDVIVGNGFRQVNTESEKIQALGVQGRPTAPPGTCAME